MDILYDVVLRRLVTAVYKVIAYLFSEDNKVNIGQFVSYEKTVLSWGCLNW